MTLIPIGRFARSSRLSVKTLHHYDEVGLLAPAVVDPDSGYRYYRLQQLHQAALIRSLRAVGLPVSKVGLVLAGDAADAVLAEHMETLTGAREALERQVERLREIIDGGEASVSHTVTTKTVPVETVAFTRTRTDHAGVFGAIPAGFGAVLTALAGARIDPCGAPFTVFHAYPDDTQDADIAMCVPVADGTPAPDGVSVGERAGGVVAAVLHTGPYDAMDTAYGTVAAWVHAHGHRTIGPSREIYLNSPADTAPADLLTEIQWPIAGDQEDPGFGD